jgi:hypothetical protein
MSSFFGFYILYYGITQDIIFHLVHPVNLIQRTIINREICRRKKAVWKTSVTKLENAVTKLQSKLYTI